MIVTLTGTNDFARSQALSALVNAFVAEHSDIALERLDGQESGFVTIREALEGLPFLAGRKMVILHNPGASKEFAEAAEQLLANMSDTTDLIIVEPKFDKRSSLYKLLKQQTDFQEFDELDAGVLARWLVNTAKVRTGSLSSTDARLLIERVGVNQQLLASELDKLLLYQSQITRETIELLTEKTPQSTVFELLEAAFAGNKRRALALYAEQRVLKVEPPQIIAMLAWQLHVLALVKTGGERSTQAIAAEAKINPYVVDKSGRIARTLSLVQLKRLVSDLLELDIALKSQTIDADEALQHFLLTLSVQEDYLKELV